MPPTLPLREPRATSSPTRLVVIDAMRCLAVVLVLGRHIHAPTAELTAPLATLFSAWRAIGWIGVDLFFVLSGFLVSALLFVEHQRYGAVRPWHFLARRGFKIYPGFYLLLVVSALWLGHRLPWQAFLTEALFVQNYLEPTVWNHTWSLAVEEHFYLMLAVAIGFATRRRPDPHGLRGLPIVVATVCVVALALRIVAWTRHPSAHLLFPTHLRLDSLAFGVGLAYAWHYHRARTLDLVLPRRRWLAASGLLLLAPNACLTVEGSAYVNTVGLSANYLGFGALLLSAITSQRLPANPGVRALAAAGFYSYSIYLWHMPVEKLVRWWLEPSLGQAKAVAIYVLGSLGVGIVMAKLVELPALRLRDRWLPNHRSRGLTAAPASPSGLRQIPRGETGPNESILPAPTTTSAERGQEAQPSHQLSGPVAQAAAHEGTAASTAARSSSSPPARSTCW